MARKTQVTEWLLKSDFKEQREWIFLYLAKKGLPTPLLFFSSYSELCEYIELLDVRQLKKIKAAWRTYAFRKRQAVRKKEFNFSMCSSLELLIENMADKKNISKSALVENAIKHYQNCNTQLNSDEKELLWEDSRDGLLSCISNQRKEIRKLERTIYRLKQAIKKSQNI